MEAYLKSIEMNKNQNIFRSGKLRKYFKVVSAGLLILSLHCQFRKLKQRRERKLKYERLRMPVYDLKEEEYERPPWVGNYQDWKYRLIRVRGRLIFREGKYLEAAEDEYPGYYEILPLILKEDSKLEHRKGLLINMGFVPHHLKKVDDRDKIE